MSMPVVCSSPPPRTADTRNTWNQGAFRKFHSTIVSRHAPKPYSGEKGPHTRPTRSSVRPAVTYIHTISRPRPATLAITKMMT